MASPPTESEHPSPPENHNARLFILFRIFFSCRFYYPVFAILFVDFGLSIEQFAYLNLAWAISIVVLEVPSGALADQFGRRTLLIAASVLMLAEMLILCLSPVVDLTSLVNDPTAHKKAVSFLFIIFLFNRIISGAAEAAASGADEALAYDSLAAENREWKWSQITLQLMRWQAFSFILVSLIGAAVYDPKFINWLVSFFASSTRFSQAQTLKFPIFLNLLMAMITLGISLRMKENHQPGAKKLPLSQAINNSIQKTYSTGMQILRHPATFMLILIGLFFDSIIRLYYTVGSFYLHLLEYEPRHFGPISMAGSLTGIAAAWIAGRLIQRYRPSTNFHIVTMLIFLGLLSLAFPIPYISVIFLVPLWLAMRLLHFFLSNYLNQITASENRATVLSFKSMNMNLAYGALVFLYGLQSKYLHSQTDSSLFDHDPEALERNVFAQAVSTWWIYFALVVIGVLLFQKIKYGQNLDEMMLSEEHKLKKSS
ncbi:MAG: MFS transporter [Verrucomicrobiota bacterium]